MGQHALVHDADCSILANYTAIMGFIRTSLQTDGWSIVTDSGDTDPTGVGAVPAQNTYTNYEIWKSPTTAGLTDIYVKIGYGRNSSNGPSLKCDVGTGSNGAGTITGDIVNANFPGGATSAAASMPMYVSADYDRLMVCFNPGGEHGFVMIERSVDANGVATNDFYTRYIYQNGNGPQQESKNIGGGTQPPSQGSMVTAAPSVWQIGSDVLIALMHPIVRGGLAHQSPNVARWGNVGFTAGTQATIDVYGSTKHYIPTVASAGSGHFNLLRYD